MHKLKKLASAVVAALTLVAIATAAATASSGMPTVTPQLLDDSQLQATTQIDDGGGTSVVPTTRTIPHWWGATLDPADGITYGYNMVGANPDMCTGAACDVTVQVDITPLVIKLDGMTFDGSNVIGPLLASPVVTTNDYGFTPAATTGDWFTPVRGPGGVLSQGDAGRQLQLLDATMRAQFGKVGASGYHLRLQPNLQPPVIVDVPSSQGLLLESGRGVVFAAVAGLWFKAQIKQLNTTADPTHLAMYVSDDTVWSFGKGNRSGGCCIIGEHGALATGRNEVGAGNSNGNAPVQTYVWASWLTPGLFARPNGGREWETQDMTVFSHELSEWADDPFASNTTQWTPYVPPTSQFGCARYLETGDPVGSAGFAMGTNTFRQGPNPNGTQSADGYFHVEDEVTLPWFMRLSPNYVSEPTQLPTPNVGRYTFMGSLEQLAGLTGPAPSCP